MIAIGLDKNLQNALENVDDERLLFHKACDQKTI